MKSKKYFISVGEPWDFDSPDGQNIINGIILKILNAKCLVFKANYVLNFKGNSGDSFVLYPRHTEGDFNDLINGANYVTINGNLLIGDFNENMNEEVLKEKSEFVLIGSIRT